MPLSSGSVWNLQTPEISILDPPVALRAHEHADQRIIPARIYRTALRAVGSIVMSGFLVCWPRTRCIPARFNEFVGEAVRMMDQGRKALRTDVRLSAGEAEDENREFIFGPAAVEADRRR